jgi:hypothetical protein
MENVLGTFAALLIVLYCVVLFSRRRWNNSKQHRRFSLAAFLLFFTLIAASIGFVVGMWHERNVQPFNLDEAIERELEKEH